MRNKTAINIALVLGCLIPVTSKAGVEDMNRVRSALNSVDIKYEDKGDIHAAFTLADERMFAVAISENTFAKNGVNFRRIWSAALERPKVTELSDEQLEWLLVQNGKRKFGGSRLLPDGNESWVFTDVPIPIPADGDGKTLESAMWMCANITGEADARIPKRKAETHSEGKKGLAELQPDIKTETPQSQPKPSSSLAADDISDILAKAENHDGIVIDGFYLGMSAGDAERVARKVLGCSYLERVNWNEHWWHYTSGGDAGICVWVLKKNNLVGQINFGTAAMKKMVGTKNPLSLDRLGRRFFAKYDLDGEPKYDGGIKMETTEGEFVSFSKEYERVYWDYEAWKTPPELKP